MARCCALFLLLLLETPNCVYLMSQEQADKKVSICEKMVYKLMFLFCFSF